MSSLPLNGLERLELNNILWYAHKQMLLIGDQNRSVPTLPENFGRGRSVQTVILVQADRTAHLEREYVQLIGAGSVTFAGGPWGYGCT